MLHLTVPLIRLTGSSVFLYRYSHLLTYVGLVLLVARQGVNCKFGMEPFPVEACTDRLLELSVLLRTRVPYLESQMTLKLKA